MVRALLGQYGALAAIAALGVGGAVGGCGSKTSSSPTNPSGTGASAQTTTSAPNGMVRLARDAHPFALPKNDLGPLDPSKRIGNVSIVFKMSPAQQADHDALLAAQLDPTSPSYHQWLTPETYAARFGAKPADIARTSEWLARQGFEITRTSRLGARVSFGGTVAQLQDAFHAEMHSYKIGSETHYAMATAPAIPAELADIVLSVHNTHDFYPHPMTRNVKVVPQAACPTGDKLCAGDGLAPPDWDKIYDVPAAYDGAGVDVVVVGIAAIAQGDINAFRSLYGLPASTVDMILVPGTGPAVGENGAGLEAILDTEWSGGIAKGANIHYVYVGGDSGNVTEAAYWAIEENIAPIMSESFGGCEAGEVPADADVIGVFGSAANLLGITYLASSGDDGAEGCGGPPYGTPGMYVDEPAAYPGVTAVGGTEFPSGSLTYSGGTVTAYSTSEEVWNETSGTRIGSGVGGISSVFSRPFYQSGISTCTPVGTLPTPVTPSAMRQVPDVSFSAAGSNNGIFIDCTFIDTSTVQDCSTTSGAANVVEIGGTSASSPSFAGVLALVTQATGGGRLGNVNPMLYALNTSSPTAFHDITLGNNYVPCTAGVAGCPAGGSYGYPATTGYDCGSGLGSIDVTNLINAWKASTSTATTLDAPATTTLSTPVALTAHVSGTGSVAIAGSVTFGFQSYLSNGQLDPDISWTLGNSAITGGSTTAGTATLSVAIPPGLVNATNQAVDVVAMYSGDAHHLASTSTLAHITFSTALTFCIQPSVLTVAPGAEFLFAAAQGVPPIRWYLDGDTTAVLVKGFPEHGSTLDETTGVFTAGTGQPGYALVFGLDSAGEETFAELTIGSPTEDAGPPPWGEDAGVLVNACPFGIDAGPLPEDAGTGDDGGSPTTGTDSGSPTTGGLDASSPGSDGGGTVDSGPTGPTGGSDDGGSGSSSPAKGCSCTTAGGDHGAPSGMLGGIVLGLGLVARRRRRSGN